MEVESCRLEVESLIQSRKLEVVMLCGESGIMAGMDGREIHVVSCVVRIGAELLRAEEKVKTGIKICKNRVDNSIKMWYYMHKGGERRLGLVYLYLYSYKK